MILSDDSIQALLNKKELIIEPVTDAQIQPASVDCTLGNHFLKIDDSQRTHLDLESPVHYNEVYTDEIVMPPHSFL